MVLLYGLDGAIYVVNGRIFISKRASMRSFTHTGDRRHAQGFVSMSRFPWLMSDGGHIRPETTAIYRSLSDASEVQGVRY